MRHWKIGMISLLLLVLVGCAVVDNQGERQALELRGSYLASPMISASCTVTADYGERVYTFSYDTVTTQKSTVLTLTAPTQLAGLVVEVTPGESSLSYEGILVDTGALSQDGLTPVTAVPALLEGLKSGYIQSSMLEEGVLTLTCGDPDLPMGTGQQLVLQLNTGTGDLRQGEIFVDGVRVVTCTFDSISWGGLPVGEK